MKNFDWFDLSLTWKIGSIIAAIVFVLMAIIPLFMGLSIIKTIPVEIGVVTAWIVFMLLSGILAYFIRHKRQL